MEIEPFLPNAARELLEEIDRGRCCLFLGAGFSSSVAGLPSVHALQEILIQRLVSQNHFTADALANLPLDSLAELLEEKLGRRTLLKILWENFNAGKIEFDRDGMAAILREFRWARIYTTNYDPFIETALRDFGLSVQVITSNSGLERSNASDVTLIKLHGCVNELAMDEEVRLVLAERDYFDFYYSQGRELLFSQLRTDLGRHTFLFLGYSLKDRSFRHLWASVFFDLFRIRGDGDGRSQRNRGAEPTRHIAVIRDTSVGDPHFWRNLRIRIVEDDHAKFISRLRDYRDKMMMAHASEYFPRGERRFLLLSGSPPGPQSLPMDPRTYFDLVWKVSHSIFETGPGREGWQVERHFRPIVDDSVYLAAGIFGDLRMTEKVREAAARSVGKKVQAILDAHPATGSSDETDLILSAIYLVWPDLPDQERQELLISIPKLLVGNDAFVIFKLARLVEGISDKDAFLRILDFVEEHYDDPGDLFDPGLSSLRVRPVARLIRELIHCLVASSGIDVIENANSRLISGFRQVTNPLITWELGLLLGERFKWDKGFRAEFLDFLAASIRRNDESLDFAKSFYVAAREPEVLKGLEPRVQKIVNRRALELVRDFSPLRRGQTAVELFWERLEVALFARSATVDFERKFQVAEKYRHAITASEDKRYGAFMTLCAVMGHGAQGLDFLDRAEAFVSSVAGDALLKQPLMVAMWETLRNCQDPDVAEHVVSFLVRQVLDTSGAQDDWIRYIFIGLLGSYDTRVLPRTSLVLIADRLATLENSPGERLLIRGGAHVVRQQLVKSSRIW